MRVLYFHQHFTTPELGGGTRSYEFSKKLIERGHQVTMVCGGGVKFNFSNKTSKGVFRGNIEGIDVIQIDLNYSNKDNLIKRAKTFLQYAIKGIRLTSQEDYDLLFATSTPLTAGIPGIWMKLFNKKKRKFIFEVRDLWPELPKALGMKNPVILKGMAILEKLSYSKSDACIGLSPGICEGIGKKVKNKPIKMIPNGCDLNLFTPSKEKGLSLKGIRETDKVAVFTGAHGIANGLDAVLDMAKQLINRGREDVKIVFIGDGKMKASLISRAKKEKIVNCLFFDPIPKTELKNLVARADIGLMVLKNVPEFYYGTSPNKFFDYIASGIPVINNYPGWLADMIKENNCGEFVEPSNSVVFADAVEKIVDDHDLSEEYGANSRKLAEAKFSRDELSNQFVDYIEKVYYNV